jgi:hypothetical protein
MNETVKTLYKEENDIFGLPQEYKGLKLYPLLLRELYFQSLFYRFFAYPKNYIKDEAIKKMSYLKYILIILQFSVNKEGTEMSDGLIALLAHITRLNVSLESKFMTGTGNINDLIIKIKIGDNYYSEEDFDNIREMVLEQNGLSIDYVESYIPDLEKKLAFINRSSELDMRDEIFIFCCLAGRTINEIEKYTLYQFKEHFDRISVVKNYEMYRPLEASGQITLKSGEIKHYFYHSKKRGRYDSILIPKDNFIKENSQMFQNV